MNKSILSMKKIIREHLKTHNNIEADYLDKLEALMLNEFKDAIVEQEKDRIREGARKELEEEDRIKSISKTKLFLFETLFLGFLVGLLVNQTTDFVSFLKGQLNNMNRLATALAILGLLVVAVSFILLSYFNHLEKLFVTKKG